MKPGNALLISTGQTAPQSLRKPIERIAGDRRLGADARRGRPLRPRHQRPADGVPRRHASRDAVGTFNYTVLGGGRIAPDASWVCRAHRHRAGADPGLGHLQQADLPAAHGGAERDHRAGAGRQDPPRASTPAATTRGSSPAPPRSRTTPSGWRSTSTSPGNQRGTVGEMDRRRGRRSSRSGASPGAATGATPTRCTSR